MRLVCWCILMYTVWHCFSYKCKFSIAIAQLEALRESTSWFVADRAHVAGFESCWYFRPRISNSRVKDHGTGKYYPQICEITEESQRTYHTVDGINPCPWLWLRFHFKHIAVGFHLGFMNASFSYGAGRRIALAGGGRPLQHCAHQWPRALHRGSTKSLRGAIWEIDRSQLDDTQPEVYIAPKETVV